MRLSPLTFVIIAGAAWAASELYHRRYPQPLQVSSEIAGHPRVTDGDTLRIDDHRNRLVGIDACEMGQPAVSNGGTFDCGAWARDGLTNLIGARTVRCDLHGKDIYDRHLGTCFVASQDLNKAMLTEGYAVVYSGEAPPPGYSIEESRARTNGRGIWAFEDIDDPRAYRAATD